jgi:pimeloyl-ACP methyl ester carboxylesterase
MAKQADWKSLALKTAGIVAGAGVTGVSAWLLYSRFVLDHGRPLRKAIDARRRERDFGVCGLISHYEEGAAGGNPVVLLHSIQAAASSYETKPLFEQYRGRRPVYAPDLPGFGFSSRADRGYSPEFYAKVICEWIERTVYRGEPVDVVALSLSGEFAARAALMCPGLFRSLALFAPTGFDKDSVSENRRTVERVRKTISVPLWSQAFFDALVTKPSIRLYLRKAFAGPVDEGLAEYCYDTSHQPGARYAPLYFISGSLFSPGVVDEIYARLRIPTLAINGDGEDRMPQFIQDHPNWSARRIPNTAGMPHFEALDTTANELDAFWAG